MSERTQMPTENSLAYIGGKEGLSDTIAALFVSFFERAFPKKVVRGEDGALYVYEPSYAAEWAGRFARGDYSEWYHSDGQRRRVLVELAPGIYPPR